ncbi:MAG: hypothetical protein RSA01_05170 [Clostridium sp.]|uniref:hypothetical protein n=1 Tax=Clostridium sp. TaxID=1506 RepID=UPI002FC8CF78
MGAPVLDCMSICKLGKKVMLSGALMEAGVASFVQAESEKIEALTEKYLQNKVGDLPTKADLLEANIEARKSFEAIQKIEEKIIEKINLGKGLYDSATDKCECSDD